MDFTRVLLVLLGLRGILADCHSQNWNPYVNKDCQLVDAVNPLTIDLRDSVDHLQLFVKKRETSKPSISLRTLNNDSFTITNVTKFIGKALMSVRLLLSKRLQVQFGFKAGETQFENIKEGSVKEMVLQNVMTTRNCPQALPFYLLEDGLWEPRLRDGKSRIGIVTTMDTTVSLTIKRNAHNSKTFLLCWNEKDKKVNPSRDFNIKCRPLPNNITHFLEFDFNKTSKEVKVNGIDAEVKKANRGLDFKPNVTEAKVYVVHDMQEFLPSYSVTSLPCEETYNEIHPKQDAKGSQIGRTLIFIGVSLLVIGVTIVITILYFKRQQRTDEASQISSHKVEGMEPERLHQATIVLSSQLSNYEVANDIYEEMPPTIRFEKPRGIETSETPSDDIYEEMPPANRFENPRGIETSEVPSDDIYEETPPANWFENQRGIETSEASSDDIYEETPPANRFENPRGIETSEAPSDDIYEETPPANWFENQRGIETSEAPSDDIYEEMPPANRFENPNRMKTSEAPYDDIYDDIPPANGFKNPNTIEKSEPPPKDHDYEEVPNELCERQSGGDISYDTINDIYEPLDDFFKK
ncbi:uncharacterized protein [Palaemon carinicauda]|uniref:uncharacterized protein n=1 Tax=Palaemon carinicauda TaxID=392227 RepID=UPI0035B5A403